jgi:hypothetical protein
MWFVPSRIEIAVDSLTSYPVSRTLILTNVHSSTQAKMSTIFSQISQYHVTIRVILELLHVARPTVRHGEANSYPSFCK